MLLFRASCSPFSVCGPRRVPWKTCSQHGGLFEPSADNMLSTFAVPCTTGSSRPPSDGLAQMTLKIKPERLKNRSKSPQSCSKSLDSSYLRPWSGPTVNIFNICKATGRVNIQHCCQHLQRMASTFQHQQVFPKGYRRDAMGGPDVPVDCSVC